MSYACLVDTYFPIIKMIYSASMINEESDECFVGVVYKTISMAKDFYHKLINDPESMITKAEQMIDEVYETRGRMYIRWKIQWQNINTIAPSKMLLNFINKHDLSRYYIGNTELMDFE